MDRLIETLRRIAIVVIWAFTIFFGVLVIVLGFQGEPVFIFVGVGILVLGWIATLVCNWILELEVLGIDPKARLSKIEQSHLPFLKKHRMKTIK